VVKLRIKSGYGPIDFIDRCHFYYGNLPLLLFKDSLPIIFQEIARKIESLVRNELPRNLFLWIFDGHFDTIYPIPNGVNKPLEISD
jgi:hypothetical protein